MTEKIVSIDDKKTRRLNSKRLAIKYPRIGREYCDLRPEYIVPEDRPYNPPDEGELEYAVTKGEPCEGYQLKYKVDLQLELRTFNSVLLYRIMKMMYGDPDIVGAYIKSSEESDARKTVCLGAGINWSYTLGGEDSILIEIRSKNSNTIFEMIIWDNQQSTDNNGYKILADNFLRDMDADIEKNKHLFAQSDIINSHAAVCIQNIFAFHYKSAEYLLLLAQTFDSRPERREISFDESTKNKAAAVTASGSIYCSAALFYMMSFESLLGILYALLKRDEYKSEVYDRLTTKADLPTRLLTIHNYCSGFTQQIIFPGSDEWSQFELLRKYRNDIVHGNLDEVHHSYVLNEDGLQFYYGYLDYMGMREERKKHDKLPLFMPHMDEGTVNRIKEIVDRLISCIISAMDENTGRKVSSWLHEPLIISGK